MSQSFHMCISVRGILRRTDRDLKRFLGACTKDDGTPYRNIDELKNELYDHLSQGHEVIPMGKCDNFDYKTGCRGHEEPESGR